eukprot:6096507-Karenia_brevis.AAC.1
MTKKLHVGAVHTFVPYEHRKKVNKFENLTDAEESEDEDEYDETVSLPSLDQAMMKRHRLLFQLNWRLRIWLVALMGGWKRERKRREGDQIDEWSSLQSEMWM